MTPFITAGAGFLAAVLWFDLMHDVQVRSGSGPELPEAVLASIAGYYRRVTTEANPMGRLVALAMLATIGTEAAQLASSPPSRWVSGLGLALVLGPVTLALARTVPRAVRLGGRKDPVPLQSRLARSVYRDHVLCLASIVALLGLQLGFAR